MKGEVNMKNTDTVSKSFKIFSYTTLFITGFYFFAHLLFIILKADLITTYGDFEYTFFLMLLFMDIVAWFIYIPFAGIVVIVQFLYLIARLADTENTKKWFYLPSFLNIVFGSFSIYGVFEFIKRAF